MFGAGLTGDAARGHARRVQRSGPAGPKARPGRRQSAALAGVADRRLAEHDARSLPFSTLPAAIGVRVFAGDQLIHGWDLATALGQPFQIPEDLAAAQLEMMRQYYDPSSRGPLGLPPRCSTGRGRRTVRHGV